MRAIPAFWILLVSLTQMTLPHAMAQALPPVDATAAPTPTGVLIRFSGQILDLRAGYVFFTTGDGFALAPGYRTVDAATGAPATAPVATRTYARAAFDPATGRVTELAVSRKPLPQEAAYGDVQRFAVALSTPYANPDLAPKTGGASDGGPFTGRRVLVQFTVQVPATTALTADVYVTTDQSLWDPTAIKLTRIDALHYRINTVFASGTKLLYLYTRGSLRSVERGPDGLERAPRVFVVRESDTQSRSDIVRNWADETQGAAGAVPGSVPTPFSSHPFGPPH